MSGKCPEPEHLVAYVMGGELPEATYDEIAAHVSQCPACERTAAGMDEASDTLLTLLRGPLPDSRIEEEPEYQEAVARAKTLSGQVATVAETGEIGHASAAAPPDRLGEYDLLAKLGEGGMGAVYRARQRRLDKIVAVKMLPADRLRDPRAVARFDREMRAVGALDHANIVRALYAGEDQGTPYLAVEYVDGVTLSDLVARLGALRVADACELARQAVQGLEHAHAHGLVHRDIKPSNLMLTRDGTVKVLDLGLALLHGPESPGPEMTAADSAMGTADYIAPEQVTDSHNVDIRADIYALGCTLYKLLAGRAPFTGPEYKNEVSKMMAHVHQLPPPLSLVRTDLPPKLAAVIERMMAKDRRDRFASPAEVAEALAPFTADCNLRSLATGQDRRAGETDQGSLATSPQLTSASIGTEPSLAPVVGSQQAQGGSPPPSETPADGRGRRRVPWPILAVALVAGGGILAARVIIIRIQDKQGHETAIEVADDSRISVERTESGVGSAAVRDPSAIEHVPARVLAAAAGSNPERRAAEWVLSLGGTITIRAGEQVTDILAAKDLPAGVWQLVKVELREKADDAGLQNLERLPNLTSLMVCGPGVTDAGLARLKALTNLHALHLHGTRVGDAGLECLTGLTNLDYLALYGTRVGDAGLRHLRRLSRLWYLELSGLPVTDAGLEHLASLTNLTDLNLSGTSVSDTGLQHLKSLTRLSTLYLDGTSVSDAGLEHLTGLTRLTVLNLRGTRVTDEGLPILINHPLVHLHLENARVSAKGFANLKAAWPGAHIDWSERNRTAAEAVLAAGGKLFVKPTGQNDERPVKAMDELPAEYFQVTRVNLVDVSKIPEGIFGKLNALNDADFDHLEVLDLSGQPIQDCRGLEGLSKLKELSLARTKVDDAGLESLKNFLELRRLVLDGCPIAGPGLKHLQDLPRLTELRLGCAALGDLGMMSLASLKKLERLSLATSNVGDEGLRHLHGLVSLQELDLDQTKVTVAGRAELQKALPKCRIGEGSRAAGAGGVLEAPDANRWRASGADAPHPAIAPFDAQKAREHQEVWAKHLGVPVEVTNSIGMKLVLIPPGEFEMGSTPEDIAFALQEGKKAKLPEWYFEGVQNEAPRHRVKITKPFYLGMHPVTQAEYAKVMGINPSCY
ncbi:MAG: protein kinase [Pirellulales bacterium]|nr:protein kinase [Pirellulales bacterium]